MSLLFRQWRSILPRITSLFNHKNIYTQNSVSISLSFSFFTLFSSTHNGVNHKSSLSTINLSLSLSRLALSLSITEFSGDYVDIFAGDWCACIGEKWVLIWPSVWWRVGRSGRLWFVGVEMSVLRDFESTGEILYLKCLFLINFFFDFF